MKYVDRRNGVELSFPDSLEVDALRLREGGWRALAVDGTAESGTPTVDALLDALVAEDMELLDLVLLNQAARAQPQGVAPGEESIGVTVRLGGLENAVVLTEQEGAFRWHYPAAEIGSTPMESRVDGATSGPRRLRFTIRLWAGLGEAGAAGVGGSILDAIGWGPIRVVVLKWAVRAAGSLAGALGFDGAGSCFVRLHSTSASTWKPLATLSEAGLPPGRRPRILLLVHGTFSSTVGSFGSLCDSAGGRGLVDAWNAKYDAVVGCDHPTLRRTPSDNAEDMLRQMRKAVRTHGAYIDAIAYSRGALVIRSLVEQHLPQSGLRVGVHRVILVGGTNAGTELARPANWKRLADLYTNLAVAGSGLLGLAAPGPAAILRESVSTLGSLVKALAEVILEEEAVPGLAAMIPGSPWLESLSRPRSGGIGCPDAQYCIVRSEFDVRQRTRGEDRAALPRILVEWIAHGFAAQLMGEPSDLVVNFRAMGDLGVRAALAPASCLDLGKEHGVHHLAYFGSCSVIERIGEWLGIENAGLIEEKAAELQAIAIEIQSGLKNPMPYRGPLRLAPPRKVDARQAVQPGSPRPDPTTEPTGPDSDASERRAGQSPPG